jgi:hypothetical protein
LNSTRDEFGFGIGLKGIEEGIPTRFPLVAAIKTKLILYVQKEKD